MKHALIFIVALMLLTGCRVVYVCNAPYISSENGCCIDENQDAHCDNNETSSNPANHEPAQEDLVRNHSQIKSTPSNATVDSNPFIGGNTAINVYLQNGAPPPTIYDGGKYPFGVNIVMENIGEADLGPGTENPYVAARLDGIMPANFGLTDEAVHQTLNDRVNGRKKNFDGTTLGGQVSNFVFQNLNFQGNLSGNDQISIRGTLCYDYSNTATTKLCMKSDMIENVQDTTLCSLTGERTVFNSGGPIHVTKIIQNPLGNNKIQVNFEVSHVGPGEFYGRSPNEDCNPSVRNTNKYFLDVNVSVQDPSASVMCYRLNNGGTGRLVMYGGTPQTISCTIESANNPTSAYTEIMTIRTFYRYGEFIEQPISIQSVPR